MSGTGPIPGRSTSTTTLEPAAEGGDGGEAPPLRDPPAFERFPSGIRLNLR